MIIDCISDLHGHYPTLDGGDLLIVAGDLTARDTDLNHLSFEGWLYKQDYKKKIIVGGNHDNRYTLEHEESLCEYWKYYDDTVYLCDSGTEFEGLKIWGSPWTKTFPGMNPHCKAFTCDTEEELNEKWKLIPDDIDILVTHSPPYGILDKVKPSFWLPKEDIHVGSKSLALKIGKMEIPPKLWVWGHIHEAYGESLQIRSKTCKMINASHVNERYKPINKPVRVIL